MPSMAAPIQLYEQMSALSAQMVEAARAKDWEKLTALEKSVIALRDILMIEDGSNTISLGEAEIRRALIQRILDDDAEIRRHTEPWMERIRQYISGAVKRREVERTPEVR